MKARPSEASIAIVAIVRPGDPVVPAEAEPEAAGLAAADSETVPPEPDARAAASAVPAHRVKVRVRAKAEDPAQVQGKGKAVRPDVDLEDPAATRGIPAVRAQPHHHPFRCLRSTFRSFLTITAWTRSPARFESRAGHIPCSRLPRWCSPNPSGIT